MTKPSLITSPLSRIASAQHQLRNKLGIVIASLEIINMIESFPADATEDVLRMQRACKDMIVIIDDLETDDHPLGSALP